MDAKTIDIADRISFESTQTLAPEAFEVWVAERSRMNPLDHYELLNGRIVMTPPAGEPHGWVGSNIQYLLVSFVRPRAIGRVYDSSQGFRLPSGDVVEPDHSFVSRERLEATPAEVGKFLRVVPDLIVEVLSPATQSRDRGEKKAIYALNGVREYWLVDSLAREVTVFRLIDERYDEGRTFTERERCASAVLAGLEFPVGELFV